jgi:hypothetical protein
VRKFAIALVIGFALCGILINDPDITETYVQKITSGNNLQGAAVAALAEVTA